MSKVTILVPICNVEKYLPQCLDSLVNQTLQDIEVICIDDGSTDSSPQIIQKYVEKDARFSVITKKNSGYGDSLNKGLAKATGKYIGILESDDFASADMYEKLYAAAEADQLDVAKGDYFDYVSETNSNLYREQMDKRHYGKAFRLLDYFTTPEGLASCFSMCPSIWSAIYRADFLKEKQIKFNPTPGASFQDISFEFQILAASDRFELVSTGGTHYRTDNANSSVKSSKKIFNICDEFACIDAFVANQMQGNERLKRVAWHLRFTNYCWNYERLNIQVSGQFLMRFYEEFKDYQNNPLVDKAYFTEQEWKTLEDLVADPFRYHLQVVLQQNGISFEAMEKGQSIQSVKDALKRKSKFRYLLYLWGSEGFSSLWKKAKHRINR